jgi:hypothetical protein
MLETLQGRAFPAKILKPTFGNYSLVPIFAVLFAPRVCQTVGNSAKSPEKQAFKGFNHAWHYRKKNRND